MTETDTIVDTIPSASRRTVVGDGSSDSGASHNKSDSSTTSSTTHEEGQHRDGIHSVVLWQMTKCHSFDNIKDGCKAFAFLFVLPCVSWFLLLVQATVLEVLGEQFFLQYCAAGQGDCDDIGQSCTADNPGVWKLGGVTLDIKSDLGFCVDTEAGHCQYLQNIVIPPSSKLVLIIVFLFIQRGVLHEMGQMYQCAKAAKQRAKDNNVEKRWYWWWYWWVYINILCFYVVRMYLIPFYTFTAAVLVLFVEADLRPSSILLNGMAVDILCGFDDFLFDAYIPPDTQKLVVTEMTEALERYNFQQEDNNKNTDRMMWANHRLFCLAMLISGVVASFDPISMIMKIPMPLARVVMPTTAEEGFAYCGDLAWAVSIPMICAVFLSIILDRCITTLRSKNKNRVRQWSIVFASSTAYIVCVYFSGRLIKLIGGTLHKYYFINQTDWTFAAR